jgi:hypothetical protein
MARQDLFSPVTAVRSSGHGPQNVVIHATAVVMQPLPVADTAESVKVPNLGNPFSFFLDPKVDGALSALIAQMDLGKRPALEPLPAPQADGLFLNISSMARRMGDTIPHAIDDVNLMTGQLPRDANGRTYYPRRAIYGPLGGTYQDPRPNDHEIPDDGFGYAPDGWAPRR